jgi:hypothetical protein
VEWRVEWIGVERCGVERCGVEWCGVVRCGVVWFDLVTGVVWCNVVWCRAVYYANLQSLYMTCTYVCNKTAITHLRSVCNRYIGHYTHCNDDLLHMCKVDNSHSV